MNIQCALQAYAFGNVLHVHRLIRYQLPFRLMYDVMAFNIIIHSLTEKLSQSDVTFPNNSTVYIPGQLVFRVVVRKMYGCPIFLNQYDIVHLLRHISLSMNMCWSKNKEVYGPVPRFLCLSFYLDGQGTSRIIFCPTIAVALDTLLAMIAFLLLPYRKNLRHDVPLTYMTAKDN